MNLGNDHRYHETEARSLTTMVAVVSVCVVLVMAFGLGKLTDTLDPLVARRGVGALLGLMLVTAGNFVPKLRLFLPVAGVAQSGAIDRFAGWTFVISGIGFVAAFLLAPADGVFIVPPLIVLAGFLAVLVRWTIGNRSQPCRLSLDFTWGRLVLVAVLAVVLWICAIFFADAIWGDNVSRWGAILLPIMLVGFSAFRARN